MAGNGGGGVGVVRTRGMWDFPCDTRRGIAGKEGMGRTKVLRGVNNFGGGGIGMPGGPPAVCHSNEECLWE